MLTSLVYALLNTVRRFTRAVSSSHYVILSLSFFAGLEVIFAFHRWIPLLLGVVLTVLLLGIFLVRAEEKGAFHPSQTILPALAVLGLTSFSLFLPSTSWLHVYFAGSSILLFFVLRHGAKQAFPTWNWVISLIILFTLLGSILGWRFHIYIPVIAVLFLVFIAFSLISLQSFIRLTTSTSEAWLLALSMSFALTELTWVLQFLPLFYLVQTSMLAVFYYVMFHLISLSYERSLNTRDIVEYISVGTVALVFILLSARWI